MKIQLVALPSPFAAEPAMNPPLGLCYISAALKKAGYNDISSIDFGLHKRYNYYDGDAYLSKIDVSADCFCIYCMTPQFKWLKECVKHIRKHKPRAIIITGGPHACACPTECLIAGSDYAVIGEGEKAVVKILEEMPDTRAIEGESTNQDELIPDREVFDFRRYKRQIGGLKAAHVVTLRGCPFDCYFCDKKSVGRKVRYRSVHSVLEEMDYLNDTYDIKAFVIYDDIFTLKKSRVFEFCEKFRERGYAWRAWSRADTLTEEILKEMKASGLTSITMGIESGDDRILKNINKGSTAEDNRNALLLCRDLHVPVRCSLMYGNPGENRESLDNTIRMVKETQPDEWNLAVLTPVPGSAFWDTPEKFEISFDKEHIKSLDYSVVNRFADSGVGNIWIELSTMTKEEMQKNLKYFVAQLEKVCPRRKIQDTIQEIAIA